jgi:hypothetical protein
MPLFTDIEGLPGEWKIDVVNPRMVRIRNMNVGDLLPANLVEYLAQALQISDGESLEMVSSYSDGDREVSVFDFGRGTLTIESASATDDATGEAGAKMQITLEAVEPQGGSPTPPDTIVASPKPSMPSPSGKVASSANRKHTSKNASKGS